MPKYIKKKLLQDLQIQTEQTLQKVITEWQMVSPDKMLKQPAENKWSAAQCLEHLNSYSRYYLPAIENAIHSAVENCNSNTQIFVSGLLGNYFYQMMLPKEGGAKKMKSPKDHIPLSNLNSDMVIREFIDHQEHLLLLLEKAKGVDLEKIKVPISIAKFLKLKLGDVFLFLLAHNLRHMLQAERALGNETVETYEVSLSAALT